MFVKKFCFGVMLASSIFMVANAKNLDTTKTKVTWTAYKFYDKTPVSGTFKDIKYTWSKGKEWQETLKGAKASINALSVDLNDETKNENVRDGFFKEFKNQNIVVVVDKVVPDSTDVNKGRLEVSIELNGIKHPSWMPYSISGNMLSARGVVDFYDFALGNALNKLRKTCEYMHEGKTWGEAAFKVEIPLK
ncbi:polyisoprenoid-binding protein [Helicobacter saguini]|uniref:Polyisoprenoid-binding protein n=1 Tax=Helicobacter saguini TaxID=1548018 RepID=A0A347VQ22_9HELI|nr:YceI family protein [Helicobacter saguini]MWV61114.1 polyisoprenoid-binding protein [Helicobacter saguini]MWV68217.1 polyisoprenoid-binding protein [Helicobacter saguini]MWV70319.1 polyisoprenoid-binding protein [Helicobacter saguini]MWV72221.1 polyisoprenoid-binding protein [Helicobacter saguini]TLD95270.1 polyisoprenoid-binding protein [Helicobacter saguini]